MTHGSKLVWATFDPADWDLIMKKVAGAEMILGIRQKCVQGKGGQTTSSKSSDLDEDPFVVGSIGLSYGTFKEGTTEWSHVEVYNTSPSPQMNRPKSYLVCLLILKAAYFIGSHPYHFLGSN